ncbi:uncharacterized protein N7515_006316 [Penicillium bovifimosum]|uniref:HNH nuclease domain-containing protein n=1 Tax=Penicillium bovifimosum TaxID=126998 RepID=A0A9W9L131_9EURO|nr:uncharacterized protein N7515_006316 [Penicillium bovifimosum]KAJ5130277.1 hypothetical protein N7515_006316 [Penicillium bovifimosum]
MAASSSSSSIASSGPSGVFSAATKSETLRLAGTECWACSTRMPDICQVVLNHDPQIPVWEQIGLFTFNFKTTHNSIPLCGACHTEFDMPLDPGYVFFPTDIQYFIDFESQDRSRRARIATETRIPMSSLSRQVPTNEEYKQHGIDKKMILPTAVGGRYSRVFLKQFLHNGEIPGIEKQYSSPKEWHGAPIASIRRAFAALGSPRFFLIVDPKIRNMLEELRRLYFSDHDLPPEQASLRVVYRPQAETSQKHQLEVSSNGESGPVKAKGEATGQTGIPESTELCGEYTEWVLGPGFTTNDVVRRYEPVFSSLDSYSPTE